MTYAKLNCYKKNCLIPLTACKQMTDVSFELFVIYINTWNYSTLSTYVYKPYISNI